MTLSPEGVAGSALPSRGGLDRNIAMESCRVTEAAALAALAEQGRLYYRPAIVYMEQLAVGPAGRGVVSLEMSVEENIEALAAAKSERVDDLTVVVLDRPRHAQLIDRIRATGARIKLISDGDVAGGIMPSLPDTGGDMLMGVGGSPEAVLTAAALKCLGGDIQCKLWPRDDHEREQAEKLGLGLDSVLTIDDLVRG